MVREAIGVAETIELAKAEACKALGVDESQAEYEVLQLPEKKVLGLFGGKEAKVKAIIRETPLQEAQVYLENLIKAMGIENAEVSMECGEDNVSFVVSGEDASALIGRRGETLDAMQYLVSLVANHNEETYYRVSIDVGGYREKRRETLVALGKKHAVLAAKKGYRHAFEPMNPYERRIIHTAVQEIDGATSWSEGENFRRHVVIGPDQNSRRSFNKKGHRNDRGNQRRNNAVYSEPQEKREPKAVDDLSEKGVSRYGKVEF